MRQLYLYAMYHPHRFPAELWQDDRDLCRSPVHTRLSGSCSVFAPTNLMRCRFDQHLWRALPQAPQQRLCVVACTRHDRARHCRPRRGTEAPKQQVRVPDVHRRDRRRRCGLV
jgi:hypothetical protein